MSWRWIFAAVLAAGLLSGAAAAVAQEAGDDWRGTLDDEPAGPWDAPTDVIQPLPPDVPSRPPRRRQNEGDPYAAPGLELGGLKLYPQLELDAVYTTNVGQSAAAAEDDFGLGLKPSLRIESDWSRHAFSAEASGDFIFYGGDGDDDESGIDLSALYRLDIRRSTRATIEGRYDLTQTGSADSEVPDTAVGDRTDHRMETAVSLAHDGGRIEGRIRAGLVRAVYEDVDLSGGGSEDNGDRDYLEPSAAARVTAGSYSAVRPFVEAAYVPRIHDRRTDRNGLKRDSDGYRFKAGVSFTGGPIWQGEVAALYAIRNFADPTLDTLDIFGLDGTLTWTPDELTAVALRFGTDLTETTDPTRGATRSWTAGVDVRHALRENVDLVAGFAVVADDVSSGTDVTWSSNAGVEWQVNPYLAWTAGYDATWFDSSAAGGDYDEHRISTGLVIRR